MGGETDSRILDLFLDQMSRVFLTTIVNRPLNQVVAIRTGTGSVRQLNPAEGPGIHSSSPGDPDLVKILPSTERMKEIAMGLTR